MLPDEKIIMVAIDFTRQAQEWLADWNAHNWERILAHYSEDVELSSPFVVKLTGRTEGVVSCVLEYHSVNGPRTAELMEFDEHGKVRRVLAHYADDV